MKQELASKTVETTEASETNGREKLAYAAPELEEHGRVEEITLQTFFGSFSP